LNLNGNDAFIEDSGKGLGSNSALTGLASIGGRAIFGLHNKAAVSTTGALANHGTVRLDADGGDGGSSLTVGGTLTNSGALAVGNATLSASDEVTAASLDNTARGKIDLTGSTANQALLDVTGSAGFGTAGVLSGAVQLSDDSAIEFASGQITSLANRAQLNLSGNDAFIEDSGKGLGSNSALAGLALIGRATFGLENKAAVSTTGALANDGTIRLDDNGGDGGSSLTVGGTLTNGGSLYIGNTTLSASDNVTAASINNEGAISLTGSSTNEALLDVTPGVAGFGTAGVLSGAVQLSGDSAIEFASGQISTIAAGASLTLSGNNAFIEDSGTGLGSNSALKGLANVAGSLDIVDGASLSTTGSVANSGNLQIDVYYSSGSSTLSIGGGLTNTGTLQLDVYYSSGSSTLSVGGALTNTGTLRVYSQSEVTADTLSNSGSILLEGRPNQALLDVTTGAAGFGTAGTLTGSVDLYYDSAVEFLSGQISTIAAASELTLYGNNAFVEDSTALGSNSALAGLANVSGSLYLRAGASVSTTGPLADSGLLSLDPNYGDGGSTLSIAGADGLTNTGTLNIGSNGLSSSDSVTANSFVNSGTVDLTGRGTNFAALNVSGATTNKGSISIATDTQEFAGAVGGAGSIKLKNAKLRFDSSVSAGQTITEHGADVLILEQAQSFAATIRGFGTGDTIDATNLNFSGITTPPIFVENSAGTGGTLTLTNASQNLTANIQMTAVYTTTDFSLVADSGPGTPGTLVKFV
jgi:hypothetical protein